MKLTELFKRQSDTDESFRELETSLSDALMFEIAPSIEPDAGAVSDVLLGEVEEVAPEASRPDESTPELRTTGYTQARLAEFAVFEERHLAAQRDLEAVSATLANVKGSHHQAREFLNSVHSSIHRSNELELAVAKLSAQNRQLFRQAEHVVRLRSQLESLNTAFKRREASLLETTEALRGSLSSTRLELVEMRSLVARLETERQDLMNSLANANSHSDRAARENEVLREKNINLAANLDTVSRKRTEAERRLDEQSAIHERDAAEVAELRSKLASLEAERQRIQKQNDALQSRIVEASESLAAIESEFEQQAKRNELGVQGLKDERDLLLARLDVSVRAEHDAAEQIADLTAKLNDSRSAERLYAERIAAHDAADASDQGGRPVAQGEGLLSRSMSAVAGDDLD